MRVLILYLVPPARYVPRGYSAGIGYISSVLKEAGHKTGLLYLESLDKKALTRRIKSFRPGLIAVSSTTDQFPLARGVIGFASENFNIPIILGGVHATVSPEEAVRTKGLLGICIGEGEYAVLELVNALENRRGFLKTRNFWFNHRGRIYRNGVRPLVEDLDSLPFPDRSIFGYQEIIDKNYEDGAEFMVGRGCPFRCTFCINPVMQDIYRNGGRYVRYRSVGNLLKEIGEVTGRYTVKRITFQDDIFCLNREWLREFCEKYPERFSIPFRCNLRADSVNEDVLGMLKRAGCREAWIGVECGNEAFRNRVLEKNVSTEKIENAFRLMKRSGIKSKAFNMIGLPGETRENIEETIRLNKKIDPDIKNATIFRPYPGTALYDLCARRGWLSSRRVSGYWEESILDQPTLPREDTYFYQMLFYYEMRMPRIAAVIRALNRIRITRGMTLFRLLHNKKLMYRLYALIRKTGGSI